MPEAVGDYLLETRLAGGPALVYRARGAQGDPVRLQVHRPEAGAADRAVRAFERLTAALTRWGRQDWPGVEAPVGTVLPDASGRFALATRWIDGVPLTEARSGSDFDPLERAVGLALDVGDTLVALHEAGAVHGAVAPHNVWVSPHGAILLGFWWSQANLRDHPGPSAPEAIASGRFDARADQWAWGRLLRSLVPPHVDAPGDLASILTRTTERDPAERFASMAEAVAALRAFEATLRTDDVDRPRAEGDRPPLDAARTEDLGGRSLPPEAPTVDLGRPSPTDPLEPPTEDVSDGLGGAIDEDRTEPTPALPPRAAAPGGLDPAEKTIPLAPARRDGRAGPWLIWTAAIGVFVLALALLWKP